MPCPRQPLLALLVCALLVPGLLAAALSPAGSAFPTVDFGERALLIVPGYPDRVVAAGDTLSESEAKKVIRWQGLWFTRLRLDLSDPQTEALASGACIRFEAAVEPGEYEVVLDLAGWSKPTGPLEIQIDGRTVLEGIRVEANEQLRTRARIFHEANALEIFFKPDAGARITIQAIQIVPVPKGAHLRLGELPPPPAASSDPGPSGRLATEPAVDPYDCLRSICEQLLRYQLSNGLFELESVSWWNASYAVRTLLSGFLIFDESDYLDSARRAIDSFVSQQDADGGWCAFYLESRSQDCRTRNLADLGTITTCLSLMAPYVPESTATGYIDAHQRYIDSFTRDHDLPGGGFSNGLFRRKKMSTPYSVATATQIMSLVALHNVTEEGRYLARAEEAARFLLNGWNTDGRPLFHPHNKAEPDTLDATSFGDVYYILEGLLWIHRATLDQGLREGIARALESYVFGPSGLLAQLPADRWIPPSAIWFHSCKANGMLGILAAVDEILGGDATLDSLIEKGLTALCSERYRYDYGVLDPPCPPRNRKAGICSSFAGLSLVQWIDPSLSFTGGK